MISTSSLLAFLDTFGVQNFSTDIIVVIPCGCFIFQFWGKRNLLFANWFTLTFNGLKVLVPSFDDQVHEILVNVIWSFALRWPFGALGRLS